MVQARRPPAQNLALLGVGEHVEVAAVDRPYDPARDSRRDALHVDAHKPGQTE